MDAHVVMVCALAIGFLLGVSGLGDKKRKQVGTRRTTTTRRQPRQQRTYQKLPRPRRRRL